MEKENYGVHIRHCCAIHGCKYLDIDCPVESGEVKQNYVCQDCSDDGYESTEEAQEYLTLLEGVKILKESGAENMVVNVESLHRILHRLGNFGS